MILKPTALVLAAIGLALAGCESAPKPQASQPSFYRDLASPYAEVDAVKALAMINEYRARSGSGPLRLDPGLNRIAKAYAETMARADKMGHAVAPGESIIERLNRNGYSALTAGENVAAGYRTLAEAFSGWRDSPRHDRGMKDPQMTLMGIGTAYNPNSKYKVFWSLIFAAPKDGAVGMPGVGGVPSVVSVAGAPVPN